MTINAALAAVGEGVRTLNAECPAVLGGGPGRILKMQVSLQHFFKFNLEFGEIY
jgi:hypothetical protein